MMSHLLSVAEEPFSKWELGGAQIHVKIIMKRFCSLNWQPWRHRHWNMTSLIFVSMF